MTRAPGDHGTYEDAMTFALDVHDDKLQTYEFLKAWREGALDEWPEFYEWLDKRSSVVGYRSGSCRNDEHALSHTYAMMGDGGLWPMCGYGWNRSNGSRFSILRGSPGSEGDCKLCQKNVAAKRPPVTDGFPHKTKWL